MAASSYIDDLDFDTLVDDLHTLMQNPHDGTADRWEIRILLARHGVLPERVAAVETMEDSLSASLRSLRQASDSMRRRYAA